MEPLPQAVCVMTVVESALELVRGHLRDKLMDMGVAVLDHPLLVHGQAVLIDQVLSNRQPTDQDALASRPTGASRKIRIEATLGPEETALLAVAHAGGGIAEEVQAWLFEAFVTTKGSNNGTGLGMSICDGLVQQTGGSMKARNEVQGAVCTITLPRSAADGERSAATEDAWTRQSARTPLQSTNSIRLALLLMKTPHESTCVRRASARPSIHEAHRLPSPT